MQTIKIKFKNLRLYVNLICGLAFTALGLIALINDGAARWTNYVFVIIGLLYLAHFFYDFFMGYLSLKNGELKMNNLYGYRKSIRISEIT